MFSAFFIKRPVFAGVVSIVIVLLGAIAASTLPIARYPQIAPPTVQVVATYPGADAETVAETVATPIEQEVNGVEDMIYLSSTSGSDGQMRLTVTFEVGTDLDLASILVQNRVALAEPRLPAEVAEQGISVKKQSPEITLLAAVSSPDGSREALFLHNLATLRLEDELARVPGVGDVTIFGVGEYGMRVWLDPRTMRAREVSVNDVLSAIREQNVQVAAGRVGGPPEPEGQVKQYTVNVAGRLESPEAFENIIVRADGERIVRVGDLGRVELGSQTYGTLSRFNGRASAVVAVFQSPGANAIEVVEGVRETIDRIAADFPEGVAADVVYDSTEVIRASIREVVVTLVIAVLLVVFTVYLFLQSVRATLIPAVTIPVSLIGTFAVMLALGFTINQLTLFGLVLAIGIVVDDAIVVVENIVRRLDETDETRVEAAIESMREVGGPIVATTLVLLAVFVPTAFLPGITGSLYRQFALTIAIATVFSSINALTLSPALGALLLRKTNPRPPLPFRLFNRFFERAAGGYLGVLRVALRGWIVTVPLIGALILLGGFGFTRLPTGFVPQEDEGWMIVSAQLPDGATLQRSQDVMERIEAIASDTPGVADVVTVAGFSLIDNSNALNAGTAFVILEDWDRRDTPQTSYDAIIGSINRRVREIQTAQINGFPTPSLPGFSGAAGFSMWIEDRADVGLPTLEAVVREMSRDASTQSAIASAYATFRATAPQVDVDVDREQIKSMGLTLGDVYATLQTYLGSAYVNDFTLFGRIYQVRVQADAPFRAHPEDIRALQMRNARGEMVPMGAVAAVRDDFGPPTVTRFNVYPAAKITGQAAPGYSSGQALDVLASMADQKLPPGMGYDWSDVSYQERAAAGQEALVFVLAFALVYLVLAAQYESWTIPISIVLAAPTAILGVALALTAGGIANTVYVQIGVVLLIGLASKAAILIVEFAKQRRESGEPPFEAATNAARIRFRAINMTALSFILGVLPLLIATGAGAESRKAIGATVFAGMISATALGVFAAPLVYYLVQRAADRLSGDGHNDKAPDAS